jgi:hypothetical protein
MLDSSLRYCGYDLNAAQTRRRGDVVAVNDWFEAEPHRRSVFGANRCLYLSRRDNRDQTHARHARIFSRSRNLVTARLFRCQLFRRPRSRRPKADGYEHYFLAMTLSACIIGSARVCCVRGRFDPHHWFGVRSHDYQRHGSLSVNRAGQA